MAVSRRLLVSGGVAMLVAFPARAADFTYRGWRFDIDRAGGPIGDDLAQSLMAQVDLIEAVNLKPDVRQFFRSAPKVIVPATPRGPGEYDFVKKVLFLSRQIDPPENPVLLHELLHAYHHQRLSGGLGNPLIVGYYERAKASGYFPASAYMFSNIGEFFAMCVSVVLWGRAARPPRTRATVQEALPEFYAWILQEFTPNGIV